MDSKLYNAVINDKVDVLKESEGKLTVGDQRTPTGSTVLHLACHYGSIRCVKEILNVYESLLLQLDSRGETALHLAAREGHYDVVELLVNKAKSSLVQPDLYPCNTSSTVIQFLIRLANEEFETALHVAVRYKHNNVVQLLVKEDPTHSYSQNMNDETPLYLASIRGDAQMMNTILDNCGSPTFGGPEGRTALHAAILCDEGFECVKLLLRRNKDLVKIADNYGWTIFHYVAYKDLYAIVEDLIGADKSVAYLADKEYKRTALHVAAEQGNVRVMKELLKHIPDSLEILDASGRNILHIAIKELKLAVFELVVSQDSKASKKLLIQRNKEGNTPLHLIALRGLYVPEIMDLKTLDWEVLNHNNLTPLEIICSKRGSGNYDLGDAVITKLLIKANAKQHLHLWRTLKGNDADIEKGTTVMRVDEQEEIERYGKFINTHMIVAALIATVALTAGFAMPGGFDGNEGPGQGSAILLRKTAFETFVVTDAIALLCSMSSIFLYFTAPFYQNGYALGNLFMSSSVLSLLSVIAMMLAFISGTYAVLAQSSALAISVSVLLCLFFPLVYYVVRGIL